MIIICGKTIAEVERDLEMAKQAIASGMPYGIGGATIEDAEKGLEMMQAMMGGAVAPIDNPNYIPPKECGCSCDHCACNACGSCEDEDADICPECGATYDEGWNGEVCDNCGDGCEAEELSADNLDGLTAEEVNRITEAYGLPKAWAAVMKSVLGL